MSNAGNSEQFDADILQCKLDILRARDIIPGTPKRDKGRLAPPPHNDTAQKAPATQNSSRETTQSSDAAEISTHKDTNSKPKETQPLKETAPLPRPVVSINEKEGAETLQEKSEIPSFDLAEEIMAEQRKITAIRRKAPGKKTEAQPVDIEQPLSEQEKIIAEIVARDIERLCRGDYSANSR